MIESAYWELGKADGRLVEILDARLSVTQSNDPLSGGHFALGTSKTPPGPATEGSGIVVHVVSAFEMADG